MAFCTKCGATVAPGTKFCNSCGAPQAAAPAPAAAPAAAAAPAMAPVAAAPAQPQKGGSSALKIILIVLGVIFFFVVLAIGGLVYVGYRAKKAIESAAINSTTSGGKTTVTTPWGTVESNDSADPQAVLTELGVEPYPGATPVAGSAATATLGKMRTASVKFTTSDAPAQVFDFYQKQHRNAMSSGNADRYSLIFTGADKAMVTIGIQSSNGQTEIDIASVKTPGKGSTSEQESQ